MLAADRFHLFLTRLLFKHRLLEVLELQLLLGGELQVVLGFLQQIRLWRLRELVHRFAEPILLHQQAARRLSLLLRLLNWMTFHVAVPVQLVQI